MGEILLAIGEAIFEFLIHFIVYKLAAAVFEDSPNRVKFPRIGLFRFCIVVIFAYFFIGVIYLIAPDLVFVSALFPQPEWVIFLVSVIAFLMFMTSIAGEYEFGSKTIMYFVLFGTLGLGTTAILAAVLN